MFRSKESTQTLLAPLAACCQRLAAAHALIQLFQASGKKIRDKSSKCIIMNYNYYIFVIYLVIYLLYELHSGLRNGLRSASPRIFHSANLIFLVLVLSKKAQRLRIPAIASACKPKSPSLESSGSFIPHKQDPPLLEPHWGLGNCTAHCHCLQNASNVLVHDQWVNEPIFVLF